MAWNRSSENGEAVSRPLQKRKGFRFPVRGAIAGVIVVLGAAVAAWWVWPDASAPVAEDDDGTKKGLIKEVTPAAAPKAEEPKPEKKRVNYWEVDASQTNGFTEVMRRKWEQERRPRMEPRKRERKRAPYEIFSHPSENAIARYLVVEPGTTFIGSPDFGERFKEDFRKSCEEPIIVSADDDDYAKELKKLVRDTKVELCNRLANGEDLSEIMMTAHQEMQKLGQVKGEIMRMTRESAGDMATKEDVADLIAAANRMLEEKGIGPIEDTLFISANLGRNLRNKGTSTEATHE